MFDAIVIGAGVIGCGIARELARWRLRIAVLEAGPDVASGASKANSGIVHAGHDAHPGSLKAKFNVEGSRLFADLSRELDFSFVRNGALVLCFEAKQIPRLEEMRACGRQNGVEGLTILGREQVLDMEPNLHPGIAGALFSPLGGICCPYEVTIALAENAAGNGVKFFFNHQVTALSKTGGLFALTTGQGNFAAKAVINAAGVHADEINNMLSAGKIDIIPRAGQYIIFDKKVGGLVQRTIFQLPTAMGKGVLVTPTVDGNLLIGPTAMDLQDKSDVATRAEAHQKILETAALSLKELPLRATISSFSGLRAHSPGDDFIIGWADDVDGLMNVAGIESPGLTSAPAIARHVAAMVSQKLRPAENHQFRSRRQATPKFRELDLEARQALIAANPRWGKVVCRCENVTEAEVVAAIRSVPGAGDLDGVKRRTRAGMGRCQGGFCSPQILQILARELRLPPTAVSKCGGGSQILLCRNKQVRHDQY
jgi:glycerol-3-phosphate dehydrogenase